MTSEELATFDGQGGKKAYVAVADVIYDVSDSPHWIDGNHHSAHQAGADLTEELKSAPHVRSLIERFPVIGQLEARPAQSGAKKPLWLVALIALLALGAFFLAR